MISCARAMACVFRSIPIAVLAMPLPLLAGVAEQFEQLDPEEGEWELEYFGNYGGDDAHVLEIAHGIGSNMAIGAEIELEEEDGEREEEYSLSLLYRLNDPHVAAVPMALMGEVALNGEGNLAEVEGRWIAAFAPGPLTANANLIMRHAREEGDKGTGIAYVVDLGYALSDTLRFSIEASGRAIRLGGDADAAPKGEHYLGPVVGIEIEPEEGMELGLTVGWLTRINGNGPASAPRISLEFGF